MDTALDLDHPGEVKPPAKKKKKTKEASNNKNNNQHNGKKKRISLPSGYKLFGKDFRAKRKASGKYQGESGSVLMKALGAAWSNLADEERSEYEKKAGELKNEILLQTKVGDTNEGGNDNDSA